MDVGRPRAVEGRLPQGSNGAPSSRTPSSQASSSGRASSPRSASTPSGSDGATSTRPTPSASAARARSSGSCAAGENTLLGSGEVEVPDPARVRAQARRDGAAGERGDEGLGPQVLVDVDAARRAQYPNLYRVSRQLTASGRSRLATVPDLDVDVLLIGGGIASATAAATCARRASTAPCCSSAASSTLPYHRPPASKEYLRGDAQADEMLVHPAGWSRSTPSTRARARACRARPRRAVATLSTKETVRYDRALVATGFNVRRLWVEGAEQERIHYLRALGNADAIRSGVAGAEHVVCVGGSYIASEVAASLTAAGARVTMVMLEDHPLERGFGATAGRYFRGVLEAHGVEVLGGEELAAFEGGEQLERVRLASGRTLDAQAAVVGVGALPDVMLARKAGLDDRRAGRRALRPGPAQLGRAHLGRRRHLRVPVARPRAADAHRARGGRRRPGRHGGAQHPGADAPHTEVPYFFSDLADWASLEYVGPALEWDAEEVDGSVETGEFAIAYREDGGVRGYAQRRRRGRPRSRAKAEIAEGVRRGRCR